jgi:hypothetical protein
MESTLIRVKAVGRTSSTAPRRITMQRIECSDVRVAQSPIRRRIPLGATASVGAAQAAMLFAPPCESIAASAAPTEAVEQRIEDFVRTGLHWLLQIAIGLALTLGARGLTGLLHRLRYGDSSVPERVAHDS